MRLKHLFIGLFMAMMTMSTPQVHAQVDSIATITLSAQDMGYITAFMPAKDGIEEVNYMRQIAKQLVVDTTTGKVQDTAQQITVRVSFDMVKRMYVAIGSQQERLSAYYNNIIKQKLFPQLSPYLQYELFKIKDQSSSDTEQLIDWGLKYLVNMKW